MPKNAADRFAEAIEDYDPGPIEPSRSYFVYGRTGTGKTTLVKTLKADAVDNDARVLLLSNDRGNESIQSAIYDNEPYQWLVVKTIGAYQEVRDAYAYLDQTDHPYEWVVLDDCTRMAEMLLHGPLDDEFGDDTWGKYAALNKRFRRLLRSFRGLGCNLLFLAREAMDTRPATAAFPGKALGTGDDKSSVLHEFDHAYRALRRVPEEAGPDEADYLLQTRTTQEAEAKARDEHHVLDTYETPDLSDIHTRLTDAIKGDIQ